MYAYDEIECEIPEDTESHAVAALSQGFRDAFRGGEGITDKEMDDVICLMLKGETVRGGIEIYNRMNPTQQKECQRIKRLTKRINSAVKRQVVDLDEPNNDNGLRR